MRTLWNETNAKKKDGILEYAHEFPARIEDVILTGPSIYIGNPLYKGPSADGKKSIVIEHGLINDNYIPRTDYKIVASRATYEAGIRLFRGITSRSTLTTFVSHFVVCCRQRMRGR